MGPGQTGDPAVSEEPPPAPGHWRTGGLWYPPDTRSPNRPVVFRQPPGWGGGTGNPASGDHRSPSLRIVVLLASAWMTVLLVPMVFTVVSGDFLAGSALAAAVAMGVVEAVLAVSGGYIFRRHGTKPQLAVATMIGVLSLGIATSIGVITATDYNGDPPWGAVFLINILVNGVIVFVAVSAGQGLAVLLERHHHTTI